MIDQQVSSKTAAPQAETSARSTVFAVALMSFSALLLELGLTRIFSVVLFYHFAFLAISIALLGLGAGAVFACVRREWLTQWTVRQLGVALCAGNSILIVCVLEVALHTAVSLTLSWHNFARLTVLYLVAAIPFVVTGLLFSIVFARHPSRITQLYGADLLGGSLACLALVPMLNIVGGPNTIVFAAVAVALAAVAWAAPRKRLVLAAVPVVLLLLIAANFHSSLIDIVYAKGVKRDPPLFARWNAISRVEVDQWGTARGIVIDADASTFMMNTDPHNWREDYRINAMEQVPSFVNVLRPHGDYAIIGPGGGIDVLRAVANGSPKVTAIEINPIIANDIMRGRFADYAFHLYQIPEVHMNVSDGRSFVRNSQDKYDVVQMTLVDTWASTAAGAFALSENNLYTVEAFREYFEHLKPDGMIAITRWEFSKPREALRVVSQAMEALHEMGVMDTTQNFIVVADGELAKDGEPVLVLAKRTPFTMQEQQAVLNHIDGKDGHGANLRLHVLYMPATGDQLGMAHPAFASLILGQDPKQFSEGYPYNVAPVTDNAPFFFFTLKPEQVLRGSDQGGADWKVNLGIAILGVVLIVSIAAVLLFLVLPLALSPETRSGSSLRVLYFIAIGLGYIMVEIAFIQRFVLFLGYPTYALTVVVFLMLLSSGAGSLVSRKWFGEPTRVVVALGFIVVALAIHVFALPHLLEAMIGLAFPAKLAMSGLLLIPLGFAMGMPFPSGLRALSSLSTRAKHGAVEWAWAMNAASSVLGSVLAIVIAVQFGLTITLACGAAAYVIAMLLLPTFRKAAVGN